MKQDFHRMWTAVTGWLAGKKTYLLAVLLVLVVVGFVAFGKLTPDTAATIFLVFVALFAASFRSALGTGLQQHRAELVTEIQTGASLMRDIVAHNTKAAVADGFAAYTQGQKLAGEIQAEQNVAGGAQS